MNIQEFIKESLCQIIEGASQAKEKYKNNVNPYYELRGKAVPGNAVVDTGGKLLFLVEFDLAVTATDHSEQSGKAGLDIKVVAVGGEKGSGASTTSVTRVKFSVPISY